MVLQVLAHAEAFVGHVDAEAGEPLRLADAGKLHNLG